MENTREAKKRNDGVTHQSTATSRKKKRGVVKLIAKKTSRKPFRPQTRGRNGGSKSWIALPCIPDEIIVEILGRLPVKSLLRFRTVCKQWRALISDSNFVKRHLLQSSMVTNLRSHHVIATAWNGRYMKSCSLYSLFNHRSPRSVMVSTDENGESPLGSISGSCNGLVCIHRGIDVFVLNPSTRKFFKLTRLAGWRSYITSYGFGYDPSIDDYKIIAICYDWNSRRETVVQINSLKANCWRPIHGFLGQLDGFYVSVQFVNGTIICRALLGSRHIIVSLDLTTEKFSEVPQPGFEGVIHSTYLGVLGDCLCMTRTYASRADVWIMEEFGVKESWNMLLSIPFEPNRGLAVRGTLWILENSKILLLSGSKMLLFDTKASKQFRIFPGWTIYHHCPAIVYVESLVDPCHANGRQE